MLKRKKLDKLEKMDALRKRMNVTYAQAKEALDICEDELDRAIVYLEAKGNAYAEDFIADLDEDGPEYEWDKEKTENFIRGVIDQIKSLIQEGNVTKVRLISDDKVLVEVPATVGAVGLGVMLFSPLMLIVSALGAVAAMAKSMVFEVVKADGTVERRNLHLPDFGGRKGQGLKGKESSEACCCGDCAETCEDEACDDEACKDEACDDEACEVKTEED